MDDRRCYKCMHSKVWTRQECLDNIIKKFCWLKWEDVLPLSTCEDYYWWGEGGVPGIKPETNRWKETYLQDKQNGVGAFIWE